MKYNAFISYRHSEPDMFVAKEIHKALETFKVPGRIQKKTGIKKIERVFRDQEELPIDSSLSDNIEAALKESEFLIVICSPRLLESKWCLQEIKTFIKLHGRNNILAVLVEGEPDEAFPEEIRFDEKGNPVEPLAADVRASSKKEMKKKIHAEKLRLLAALLHCSYDDLKQRHRERMIKRIITLMALGMVLLAGFVGYYAYSAAQIRANFKDKQINQSKYLADTATTLLKDGDRMTAIQVALEALYGDNNDRPYVAKAEYALNQTLYNYSTGSDLVPDRTVTVSQPITEFYMSDDGAYTVTLDQGNTATVFDTVYGEKVLEIKAPVTEDYTVMKLCDAAFTKDNNLVVVYSDEIFCYDLDGKELWKLDNIGYDLSRVGYYEKCDYLIFTASQTIRAVDQKTGKIAFESELNAEEAEYTASYCKMAFTEDGSKVAIGLSGGIKAEGPEGKVLVLDLKDFSYNIYTTTQRSVLGVKFDGDEKLITVSDALDESGINVGHVIVEELDLSAGGAKLWNTYYDFEVYTFTGSDFQSVLRQYTDTDGIEHNDFIFCHNNLLEAVDANTGEVLSEFHKSSPVTGLFVIKERGTVITMELNGNMTYQDTETGREANDLMKETGLYAQTAKVGSGGIVGIQGHLSPDLILMKYAAGAGIEEKMTFKDDVNQCAFSADGSLLAVQVGYDAGVKVYDTDTMELKGEVVPDKMMDKWIMTDAGTVLVFSDHTFYKLDSKDFKVSKVESENSSFGSCKFDTASHRFIAYERGLFVIDYETMEVIADVGYDANVKTACIGGENGQYLVTVSGDNEITLYDVKAKEEVKKISNEKLIIYLGYGLSNDIDMTSDGKKVVFHCVDGYARVYDLETDEITDEIIFNGQMKAFLQFSPDDNYLLTQGDDLYFRVYDLKNHNMKHLADKQYYEIRDVRYDGDKVELLPLSGMYILNLDTWELVCDITGGRAVNFEKDMVLVGDYGTLYSFPYFDTDELISLADEQLHGQSLSDEKRLQLNMD